MWNPNLTKLLQPEVAIPSETKMLELYDVMKLDDFLYLREFHSENELKVEINNEVRIETEPNGI